MPLAPWTLQIAPRDAAAVLAQILAATRKPATLVLQELSGVKLGVQVLRSGQRHLTGAEAGRLDAEPIARCNWRHGLLKAEDGLIAASVSLVWLPARLPWDVCEELNADTEPAGVILDRLPGGMQRIDRRALATTGIEEVTGADAATRSTAVLFANGMRVGIAEETVTLAFAGLLGGVREGR